MWKLGAGLLAFGLLAAACGGDDSDAASSTTTGGSATSGAPATTEATFAAGTTMAKLKAAGKITIGTKFDQPLFGLKNPTTNEVEGFDAEIGRLIAKQIFGEDIDDKLVFVETPSKIREDSVEQGTVDLVIATYTINDARKQRIDFAGPYYVAGQDILVKKDDTTIKSVDDLNGKKVCSVQGSTSLTNVQAKAPQADVSLTFDKYSLCVEALLDGRVQAVTTDNIILLGFVNDNKDTVKLVGNPFTTEPYGIGLKKGDTAFRNWVNDQLELFAENGSYAEAWDATACETGEPAPEPPAPDRYAG
jgi:glutamate transport system substrate-binding protein